MWNLNSRVHVLHSFTNLKIQCYVKRDDELGCGISGTKLRKYSSLIPCLLEQGIQHLIIIAGAQSNNLLSALQIARELQIRVTAFLIQPKHEQVQGNYRLSRMFLKEDDIQWIPREDWGRVEEIAKEYLQSLNVPGFVLNEGAGVHESMSGAMTLADDIVRNEQFLGFQFNHIFVDAGTGFSAIALIKRMHEMKHPARIHVLLLADKQEIFLEKLHTWYPVAVDNFDCFIPGNAKAFGSVNQTVKNEIKRLALEEGILADPIYSAKLFYETRKYIEKQQLVGKVLIVHSGGTLSLAGFEL